MNKKQVDMLMKVFMDDSQFNPYKHTIQKVNKVGKYRLKGAAAEDIEQYSYLLIIEFLNSITINYWNSLEDDSEREKKLITYCSKGFEKLSKNEGINNNITCLYNKDSKKYEYRYMNNVNIDDYELCINTEAVKKNKLAQYIFATYMNEAYLTPHQLKYIHTVTHNYIDEHGNVCDIGTNDILYTKQASYKHRTGIYLKLNSLIDSDPNITTNSNGRWIINN